MDQIVTSCFKDLIAAIQSRDARKIGIDGGDGSGKSTLARKLGAQLALPVIEVDAYLEKQRGGYLDFIRYDELQENILMNAFVIEGVCLLEVLNRAVCEIDLLIYVQRMSNGIWPEEHLYGGNESADLIIEREEGVLHDIAEARANAQGSKEELATNSLPLFAKEIIRYHADRSPWKKAGVLFQWDRG